MEIIQREQKLAETIGADRMELIMKKAKAREAVVEKYMRESDNFKEWNALIGVFQNSIQNNWLFARGNYDTSFQNLVKDIDETLCKAITKTAGGELLELCESMTSRNWTWGIVEKWKCTGMSRESAIDMVAYIVGKREEMCLSLAESMAYKFKGRDWMWERTDEQQAKEITIERKTKVNTGSCNIGDTVMCITAMTTPMDMNWIEEIRRLPKGEYEAAKWHDFGGKFKVKAFSQTSDIVFTDDETLERFTQYVRKGLAMKALMNKNRQTA
jgi:hypothetical protein